MLTIQESQIEVTALNKYDEIYVGDQAAQNAILIYQARRLAPFVSANSEGIAAMPSLAIVCVDDIDDDTVARVKAKVLEKIGVR